MVAVLSLHLYTMDVDCSHKVSLIWCIQVRQTSTLAGCKDNLQSASLMYGTVRSLKRTVLKAELLLQIVSPVAAQPYKVSLLNKISSIFNLLYEQNHLTFTKNNKQGVSSVYGYKQTKNSRVFFFKIQASPHPISTDASMGI